MIGLMNLRNIDLALARCQHTHGQFPHSLTCFEGQHKALSKQVLHRIWASGILVGENADEEGRMRRENRMCRMWKARMTWHVYKIVSI